MAERNKQTEHKEFDINAETAKVREEVVAGAAPGTDPDSRQRLAKHLEAVGADLPDGVSSKPVTEKDREQHIAAAAKRRKDAGTPADATPTGRSTRPSATS